MKFKSKQYKRESYEIEFFPKENEISVLENEIIALSGNTGGTSGPHLHFEIGKDGVAVDPLSYFPELNKLNISVE